MYRRRPRVKHKGIFAEDKKKVIGFTLIPENFSFVKMASLQLLDQLGFKEENPDQAIFSSLFQRKFLFITKTTRIELGSTQGTAMKALWFMGGTTTVTAMRSQVITIIHKGWITFLCISCTYRWTIDEQRAMLIGYAITLVINFICSNHTWIVRQCVPKCPKDTLC